MNLPALVLPAMLAFAAISMTALARGPAAATNAAVCAAASLAASVLWLGQSHWKSKPRWIWLGLSVAGPLLALVLNSVTVANSAANQHWNLVRLAFAFALPGLLAALFWFATSP